MKINITFGEPKKLVEILNLLISQRVQIMKITDLVAKLTSISEQEQKVLIEVSRKIDDLQDRVAELTDQLVNLELPIEVVQAVEAVQDGINALDAIVEDAPADVEQPAE